MENLYTNGTILTMTNEMQIEAIIIKNAKIEDMGDTLTLKNKYPHANIIDLKGKTLMPAFIDAHSHISAYAFSFLQVSLNQCKNFKEIISSINNFIIKNNIKDNEWIIGQGYDNNNLEEGKHPNLELIDEHFKNNPVVIKHISGHMGIFNKKALEKLNITDEEILKTGYMEESKFFSTMKKVPMPKEKDILSAFKKAEEKYAKSGFTTAQEGMLTKEMIPIIKKLQKEDLLYLDIIAYMDINDCLKITKEYSLPFKEYINHFKIEGLKIFLDGSPQGRTAWMKTPYKNQTPPYYATGTMSDDSVDEAVKTALKNKLQLIAHCNGDKAIEQYLTALQKVNQVINVRNIRPVIIHSQFLRKDQSSIVKELGIIPSFFISHVYYWGDTHIKNFGKSRAEFISPAMSALKDNIIFTFHEDCPVIQPNSIEAIWCAVNRYTKNGTSLGKSECIPVIEALKATTINAAYQCFEEKEKGSIEIGKNADFVILSHNPLKINKENIKDIQVIKTIKDDRIIYSKEN